MLSICCQWLEPFEKRNGEVEYRNVCSEKSLQLGRYRDGKYTEEEILERYLQNVTSFNTIILPRLLKHDLKGWRMSSNVITLWDFCGHLARESKELVSQLEQAGKTIREQGIRWTSHPGQFTVLSSDNPTTVRNAKVELEYHAWVMDTMGLSVSPQYAINIHGGKGKRSAQLIKVIKSLPENVRGRLTLENDEYAYNIRELEEVADATGVPLVWDSHHHEFNDGGLSSEDAMEVAMGTWPTGVRPLQHISNTPPKTAADAKVKDKRKHSYYIHYIRPHQEEVMRSGAADVEVEAKGKNLAVFKMADEFNLPFSA